MRPDLRGDEELVWLGPGIQNPISSDWELTSFASLFAAPTFSRTVCNKAIVGVPGTSWSRRRRNAIAISSDCGRRLATVQLLLKARTLS